MSKEVKRWSHHTTWEGSQIAATMMALRDDGQFVSWNDYDALLAERDRMAAALDEIGGLSRALRHGGPDLMDLQDLSNALEEAIDIAHDAISALQGEQP